MKVVQSILVCVLLLSVMVSCEHTVSNKKDDSSLLDWEMITLASEDELNVLLSRGDENIVDWQLSKEFAELWLIYGQESGEYPSSAELLPLPIAIYSSNGDIKFYEFRIIDNYEFIGSIVGVATKNYGCPIVFEGKSSGYSVDLKKLYDTGKLTNDDLPRIIDDGYPSVVVGRTTLSKGVNSDFDEYINLESGETVQKGDIKQIVSYDEARNNYPELFEGLSEEDIAKMEAEIAKYNQDAEKFWNVAVESKGNILTGLSKGTAKNDITSLWNYENDVENYKGKRMDNYWAWNGSYSIENYGSCGPVAEGFVLDYLHSNGLTPNWLDFYDKYTILKNGLGETSIGAVLPHKMGSVLSQYSDYYLYTSGCICPEKAINNGLPGINLRLIKPTNIKGGAHYRPIIGYKKPGWFIFKWWQIQVLDLVDCQGDERKFGRWETYIPVYHFWTWNVWKR